MQRRKSLSRNEVLSVMRLMTEVAGHRGLPQVQRQLIAQWVARQVGTTSGVVFTCGRWRAGQPITTLDYRLIEGGDEVFNSYIREVVIQDPYSDPYVLRSIHSRAAVDLLEQQQIEHADKVLQYGPYPDWKRDAAMRDGLFGWARVDDLARDVIVGVSAQRVASDRPFSVVQKRMLRLLIAELRRLALGRGYAMPELAQVGRACPDGLDDLSPRLHELARLLLTGLSMSQVALAMGLSVHTAREYTQAVYRHLGVRSRGELLALVLGDEAPSPTGGPGGPLP